MQTFRRLAILGGIGFFAVSSSTAQTTACAGKLVPLKPTSLLSCPTPATICVTDSFGLNGHWLWVCQDRGPRPSGGLDPSVITSVQPPQIESPLTILQRIEQLRQLRLQNQQLEQQNQQLSSASPATGVPDVNPIFKAFYSCGILDGMLKALSTAGKPELAQIVQGILNQTPVCEAIRKYATAEPAATPVP